jgi:hypothetical protein
MSIKKSLREKQPTIKQSGSFHEDVFNFTGVYLSWQKQAQFYQIHIRVLPDIRRC